jgi:hypothetical protein
MIGVPSVIPKEVTEALAGMSAMCADISAMKALLTRLVQIEEQRLEMDNGFAGDVERGGLLATVTPFDRGDADGRC